MRFDVGIPGLTLFPAKGGQPAWAHHLRGEDMVTIARCADALGYDAIGVPWHLVIPKGEWERNMGARWPHALAAAGILLGATSRIRIKALVVVPHVQPIELAKSLATLDWMSDGRVVPVLLAGYNDDEFAVLGAPYEHRGEVMDEYVAAMVELWTSDEPRFEGTHVRFRDVAFEPKPVQRPFPLLFGGRTRRAVQRVARWGHGWSSFATPHAEMPAMIDYIRSQPEYLSAPRPLEISAYFVEATHDPHTHEERAPNRVILGKDAVLEQLHHLAALGVTTTGAPLGAKTDRTGRPEPITSLQAHLERLHWFSEEIMPHTPQAVPAEV